MAGVTGSSLVLVGRRRARSELVEMFSESGDGFGVSEGISEACVNSGLCVDLRAMGKRFFPVVSIGSDGVDGTMDEGIEFDSGGMPNGGSDVGNWCAVAIFSTASNSFGKGSDERFGA